MIRRATLGLRAVSDVAEAVKWYDERTPGLGNEFVSAVDEVVETLRRLPESGHIVYGDIRRFPLRQFPYAIYYRVVKSSIRVRACLHDRRRAHVRETAIVWRATSNVVGSRHEEAEWHATCSPNAPNKRIGAATMTSAKRETSRGQTDRLETTRRDDRSGEGRAEERRSTAKGNASFGSPEEDSAGEVIA
jgi:plasmid stabilization system protein ParE